jgi:hypothetical protein
LVGKYLHWNPRIEEISRVYLRRTFRLGADAVIPPVRSLSSLSLSWAFLNPSSVSTLIYAKQYITIHVRHGDFKGWCDTPVIAECFAPLSSIARRVEEVREELQRVKGISIAHVILTSDEKDRTWWEAAAAYGWHRVDHSATAATYGDWYPVLIDTAIQSGGKGFVGTDRSTVSLLAARRVEAWNDGVVRSVMWGRAGADDH